MITYDRTRSRSNEIEPFIMDRARPGRVYILKVFRRTILAWPWVSDILLTGWMLGRESSCTGAIAYNRLHYAYLIYF